MLNRLVRKEKGQGMVEYGLILALVSIVSVGLLFGVGGQIKMTFDKVVDSEDVLPDLASHTVTFKDHEGNVINTFEVADGDNAPEPEVPIIDGYTFNGWDKSFDNVTGDMTVSGIFIANKHTITFLNADGSLLGLQKVSHGGDATEPNIPRLPGEIDTSGMWSRPLSNITSDREIKFLYHLVGTPQELQAINNDNITRGRKYMQIGDIDMLGFGNFTPIGTENNEFTGTYNGMGFVINRLNINKASGYAGLFGNTSSDTTLDFIGLTNATISGGLWTGGLVGYNKAAISDSYLTGKVSGVNGVGGLVGGSEGPITNSYVAGPVSGDKNTGGVVGIATGTIKDSYATGRVSGGESTGGLMGVGFDVQGNSAWANDVGSPTNRHGHPMTTSAINDIIKQLPNNHFN